MPPAATSPVPPQQPPPAARKDPQRPTSGDKAATKTSPRKRAVSPKPLSSSQASAAPPAKEPRRPPPPPAEYLFESQIMAPAPGTTFYQLALTRGGEVVLRDWPRPRYSQLMAKQVVRPGESTASFALYAAAEDDHRLATKVKAIFGQDVYDKAAAVVTDYLQQHPNQQMPQQEYNFTGSS
ncbi:hypothetical protein RI367_007733 [Sorochytrium milnesiophthora]